MTEERKKLGKCEYCTEYVYQDEIDIGMAKKKFLEDGELKSNPNNPTTSFFDVDMIYWHKACEEADE